MRVTRTRRILTSTGKVVTKTRKIITRIRISQKHNIKIKYRIIKTRVNIRK